MQKPKEISPAAGWLATLYSVLVLGDFLRIYGDISQWKVWNGWVKEVQCTLYNWSRWDISSNVVIAFYNLQQAWIHGSGRCILQKLLPDCWKSAPKSITMDEFSKVSPPASIKSWFIPFIHAKFVKLGASRLGRSLQKISCWIHVWSTSRVSRPIFQVLAVLSSDQCGSGRVNDLIDLKLLQLLYTQYSKKINKM